jgi:hypothetical protein
MKIFWPTFWATLAAILVAAALIGLFIEVRLDAARLAAIKAQTAALKAEREEKERVDAILEDIHKKSEKEAADLAAKRKLRNEKEEKEAAEYRKAYRLPEPIYPTLEEAFKSPTPQP